MRKGLSSRSGKGGGNTNHSSFRRGPNEVIKGQSRSKVER